MSNIPSHVLHSNWVPISLVAILVPILSMGIQSYTMTQRNTEDIQLLNSRLLDKLQDIDDKIVNSDISIAEIRTDIAYMKRLLDAKRSEVRQ